jgi:hypothetical protein
LNQDRAESGAGTILEGGLDTSNGLDFVRERLALIGKTLSMHRPLPADARRVAEVLLSQEGRELRIGPRARPRG